MIADPDNEPNFYAIAKAYPLPCQTQHVETDQKLETIVPGPMSIVGGQQVKSDGMPPPSAIAAPSPAIQSLSSVSPLAAILGSAMSSQEGGAVPQNSSVFQQPNTGFSMPSSLFNVPQGLTSSSNSLLAAITQGTYSFPNNPIQVPGSSPALQQPGGNTTLNLLEALLVRKSQVTEKHDVENPTAGRPAKVPRFAQAPSNVPNKGFQDVAQSLATVEKFRSEAQRLEAERKRAEELQQAASTAAQSALLAALLNGTAFSNGVNFGGGNL